MVNLFFSFLNSWNKVAYSLFFVVVFFFFFFAKWRANTQNKEARSGKYIYLCHFQTKLQQCYTSSLIHVYFCDILCRNGGTKKEA